MAPALKEHCQRKRPFWFMEASAIEQNRPFPSSRYHVLRGRKFQHQRNNRWVTKRLSNIQEKVKISLESEIYLIMVQMPCVVIEARIWLYTIWNLTIVRAVVSRMRSDTQITSLQKSMLCQRVGLHLAFVIFG